MEITDKIERITGKRPSGATSLAGGSIADVTRLDFDDGTRLVAKTGENLTIEGDMLHYMKQHSDLPVPEVVHAEDDLLVMTYIDAGDALTGSAQSHAAELLAALHNIGADCFGFETDTLIGPVHQPNPWTADWLPFFRDQRLIYMGRVALDAGQLPGEVFGRLEKLSEDLDKYLPPTSTPALIHGDMWGGNVLCKAGRIAGFVDPALYFADPEIELAFSTLFNTFGDAFFDRYQEIRPLAPGFFEERRDLYNLYPLLVHARLFGGGYVEQIKSTLSRFV